MEFSTNRRVALIVLIVSVCLFTVIGVNKSLSKVAADITQGFYDGVENNEGYTEKSIQSHLDNVANAANGLSAILLDKTVGDTLKVQRNELLNAATLHEKYTALEAIYNTVSEILLSSQLPYDSKDADAFSYYISTLTGAYRAIGLLSYNDKVDEYYNRTLKTFPVSILSLVLSPDGPEYFK